MKIRAIAAVALSLGLAGCSAATGWSPTQAITDVATTTAVKTRLAKDARIGTLTGIGVHTTDDLVTLTGTVADEAERQHIGGLARQVAGDNKVVNNLRVEQAPAASGRGQKE